MLESKKKLNPCLRCRCAEHSLVLVCQARPSLRAIFSSTASYALSPREQRVPRTWRKVTTDAQIKWENFLRFLKSDDIYMLFHSDLIFNVSPKRAFAPGEVGRFRERLLRKTSATK